MSVPIKPLSTTRKRRLARRLGQVLDAAEALRNARLFRLSRREIHEREDALNYAASELADYYAQCRETMPGKASSETQDATGGQR